MVHLYKTLGSKFHKKKCIQKKVGIYILIHNFGILEKEMIESNPYLGHKMLISQSYFLSLKEKRQGTNKNSQC